MTLILVFLVLYVIALILLPDLLVKKKLPAGYRRTLFYAHFVSAFLLATELILYIQFDLSYRGLWFDKILYLIFLISAVLLFSCFRETPGLSSKLYFGFYTFAPLAVLATLPVNVFLFFQVATYAFGVLDMPTQYYSDCNYAIRSKLGILAADEYILIEKTGPIEKEVGQCRDCPYDQDNHSFRDIVETPYGFQATVLVKGTPTTVNFDADH